MITEHMQLNTARDAATWAANLGLNNDAEVERVSMWLWENKPFIGCTYAEHPIASLSLEQFWDIAESEIMKGDDQ